MLPISLTTRRSCIIIELLCELPSLFRIGVNSIQLANVNQGNTLVSSEN